MPNSIDVDQRIKVLNILKDNEATIKLDSEHEIIAFFDHDSSIISAKIDLTEIGVHCSNYLPRELTIKIESSPPI